ncbi:MAG: carboxypeptidase regulatory-like domain-containing protein, partial [Chloroflexi bacterium]|nr:carboxypeptidase regulatory-like domain-containing protein [Chloroflexota bacterium]
MSSASAQGPQGVIEGRVVNKTAQGKPVTGDAVKAVVVRAGVQPQDAARATIDADGRFRLAGLSLDDDPEYSVVVTHDGIDYTVGEIRFPASETSRTVEVAVYDLTSDPEVVKVEGSVVIVSPEQGFIRVSELHQVANASDKAYRSPREVAQDKFEAVRFSLPFGAGPLSFAAGMTEATAVRETVNDVIDTIALEPGQRGYAFSYEVVYTSPGYRFTRRFFRPTTTITFLVAESGVKVSGRGLVDDGTAELLGRRYQRFTARDVRPDSRIELRLDGLAYP